MAHAISVRLTGVVLAGMAEWQTRSTQNALSERACGFKSHFRHQNHQLLEPEPTLWTLRVLVDPETPGGVPATTTTSSPGLQRPSEMTV